MPEDKVVSARRGSFKRAVSLVLTLVLVAVLTQSAVWRYRASRSTAGQQLSAKEPIGALAFSHDGSVLASVGGADDAPGEIVLWDVNRRQAVRTMRGHRRPISCVAFSPDDTMMATGSLDGEVRLWNRATGACLRIFAPQEEDFFSHGGSSSRPNNAPPFFSSTLRTDKGTPFFSLISDVAFSADGKTLYSGNWDGVLAAWDVARGTLRSSLQLAQGTTMKWKFSPGTKWVATNNAAFQSGTVSNAQGRTVVAATLFDVERSLKEGTNTSNFLRHQKSRAEQNEYLGNVYDPYAFAFSPDESTLIVSAPEYDVKGKLLGFGLKSLDVQTRTVLWETHNMAWRVSGIAFSKDGQQLVSLTKNGLRLWQAKDGRLLKEISDNSVIYDISQNNEQNAIYAAVALSPDGTMAASTKGSAIYLWKISG